MITRTLLKQAESSRGDRFRNSEIECPRCHATKVLRTRTDDGGAAFACSHCDHLWSQPLQAPPRVLVADDEEGIRLLMARALRSAGYEVVTTSDGEEALQIAEEQGPFDVFLLDVRMPEMTGDEVATELRRRDPDSKILYFTGFVDQLFTQKADLWEHEAFLEKPARPTALLEAVSLLLFGHIKGPGA
ncbi:MAG TPA: response regulator [Vicinamibacterales bacterium]|nr:response regulator [Vicinamibacterales bacterium]